MPTGTLSATAPVRGSTDAPRDLHVPIFSGVLPEGGYLLPAEPAFVVAPTSGVDGAASLHYERALDPESTATGGYQNLRIGADLPLDASLSAKVFGTAYLELWISGKGNPTSSWSEIWIRLKQADGSPVRQRGRLHLVVPEQVGLSPRRIVSCVSQGSGSYFRAGSTRRVERAPPPGRPGKTPRRGERRLPVPREHRHDRSRSDRALVVIAANDSFALTPRLRTNRSLEDYETDWTHPFVFSRAGVRLAREP